MKIFFKNLSGFFSPSIEIIKKCLKMNSPCEEWLRGSPTRNNVLFLIFFSFLSCCFSFYFPGTINLHEYGASLSAAEAVLEGLRPYRDFIPLNAPLNFYIPAMLMKYFGIHLSSLLLYFSLGHMVILLLAALIGRHYFKTRLAYFLFMFVFLPQIFLNSMNGFQYFFSLLSFLFAILFFERSDKRLLFYSGICGAIGFLFDFAIGMVFSMVIILGFLLLFISNRWDKKKTQEGIKAYFKAIAVIGIPFFIYSLFSNMFFGFVETSGSLFSYRLGQTFLYPFLFLIFYFFDKGYVFFIANSSGKKIRKSIVVLLCFWVGLSIVSGIYFYQKKIIAAVRDVRALQIPRAQKVLLPIDQARDIETLVMIVKRSVSLKDKIFIYPDGGALYFFMERPFYGRFPMAGLSGFNEKWHEELMALLKKDPPQYVILPKIFNSLYEKIYLGNEKKRKVFNEIMWFISEHYTRKGTTLDAIIYKLNQK